MKSKKQLKFAFVSTQEWSLWGGSEELWSQSASKLCQQSVKVFVSVAWWSHPSKNIVNLQKNGIDVSFRKRLFQRSLASRTWCRFKLKLGIRDESVTWLRGHNPDLVIISQGNSFEGIDWMELCKSESVPYITIVQCVAECWWPHTDERVKQMADTYRQAKKIFFVSHHNKELLEQQIGEQLPNATVVWNPFNIDPHKITKWPSIENTWNLACVARLEPIAKGQDLLFKVLSLPQWTNRSICINLYGTGSCANHLKNLCKYYKLNMVNFKDHVTNIQKIWEDNHMLVLPSRYEGLPLALVEAMWCARPALITDVGGNTEVCTDGVTGFVAAAPTFALLSETMERAWNLRDQWQEMGATARRRAEQMIPMDPIGQFCERLMECVQS